MSQGAMELKDLEAIPQIPSSQKLNPWFGERLPN